MQYFKYAEKKENSLLQKKKKEVLYYQYFERLEMFLRIHGIKFLLFLFK